jgi:hypothetical protein
LSLFEQEDVEYLKLQMNEQMCVSGLLYGFRGLVYGFRGLVYGFRGLVYGFRGLVYGFGV